MIKQHVWLKWRLSHNEATCVMEMKENEACEKNNVITHLLIRRKYIDCFYIYL